MQPKEDIVFYPSGRYGNLEVMFKDETLWLTLNQVADLFERDKSVISRHLTNIFREGELIRDATVAKNATVQTEGKRDVIRYVEFYNLDVIISVGYRVNSKRGTQFRIWATKVLKEKLLESVNKVNADKELSKVVRFIARITAGNELGKDEAIGLLNVITEYDYALDVLDRYDHQELDSIDENKESILLTVDEVRRLVSEMKSKYSSGDLFGREKDNSLESSLAAIYQTYDGKELYRTPEEKAANLLYFLTKNHSFVDGNKRIAAATFICFLHKNQILFNHLGIKIIDNNTLVALTLMLAESNPNDRIMLVKVITHLLNNH